MSNNEGGPTKIINLDGTDDEGEEERRRKRNVSHDKHQYGIQAREATAETDSKEELYATQSQMGKEGDIPQSSKGIIEERQVKSNKTVTSRRWVWPENQKGKATPSAHAATIPCAPLHRVSCRARLHSVFLTHSRNLFGHSYQSFHAFHLSRSLSPFHIIPSCHSFQWFLFF